MKPEQVLEMLPLKPLTWMHTQSLIQTWSFVLVGTTYSVRCL